MIRSLFQTSQLLKTLNLYLLFSMLICFRVYAEEEVPEVDIAPSVNESTEQSSGNTENELDELLRQVKNHQSVENSLTKAREEKFIKAKDQQQALLEKAKAEFLSAQQTNNPLMIKSNEQEAQLVLMRKELEERTRELGDIYNDYNQFAGDYVARMRDSLVSVQFPTRGEDLDKLAKVDTLPNIATMRLLMLTLQQEMTEAGKINHFKTDVVQSDGRRQSDEVTRIATFSLESEEKLLRYIPTTNEVIAISPNNTRSTVYKNADGTSLKIYQIDPTRGSLLSLLGKAPTLTERIYQGKEVGFTIMILAVIGLLVAFYRMIYLLVIKLKIQKQLKNIERPNANNPLGRVLLQYQKSLMEAGLQARLDEAILKEMPALEQSQSFIKLLAAMAPLLGLLGTVTGMIETFQSISLYGSGDPKLMASGISQALVTTVQGLVAAIPLLFCHNIMSSMSRSLIQILDEQSVGILARSLESGLLESRSSQAVVEESKK